MSSGPQGPGWWLASNGRWYPPQPAVAVATKSTRGIWIAVAVVVVVLVAAVGIGGYLVVRVPSGDRAAPELNCPPREFVGERGRAWTTSTKSYAMAVGSDGLMGVEVESGDASVPDLTDAAVAILERVLR